MCLLDYFQYSHVLRGATVHSSRMTDSIVHSIQNISNKNMDEQSNKKANSPEKSCLTLPSMSTVDAEMTKQVKDKIKDSIEEPELDSGLPHTVKLMSQHTICLPREWRQFSEVLRKKLEQILLDQDMKDDLESSHAINWCRSAKHLYPIKIAGKLLPIRWGISAYIIIVSRYIECRESVYNDSYYL